VASPAQSNVIRFGTYEFAQFAGELRKGGIRVRLEGQPLAILKILLERPGELVAREQLQKKLWPADTFVDFEHSLNAAVKRLRAALNDSADHPLYIETLARRGYRFIAPVDAADSGSENPAPVAIPPAEQVARNADQRRLWPQAAVALLVVVAVAVWSWREWRHRVAPPAGRVIHSLAVLPLQNLSGDPSQDYFADGLTEELIGMLSKIHGLRVISRTSAMHFKNTQLSVPEIAKMLGVDAIVEGSIVREGRQVRVHAQLIRAATDEHIWAEEYQRQYGSLLEVEEEVSRSIADQIEVSLTPEDGAHLASTHPVDPEATRIT
jgi:TolB-like protein/DNA-binding winged helix-turn-helix (wHTH) protein